jgi:hypothetical protein
MLGRSAEEERTANGGVGVAGLAGTPDPGLPGRGGTYFVGGLQTGDLDKIFR